MDNDVLEIRSAQEALAWIERLDNGEAAPSTLVFGGEFAALKIVVDGPQAKYHGTVPGEVARGLWEFQEAIYKASAFALYGIEDIRRLTVEQRRDFELVFAVKDGSSWYEAPLNRIAEGLKDGFTTMSSRAKATVIIAAILVLTTGYFASGVLESQETTKREEIKAELVLKQEEHHTKQFELLANLAAEVTASNATIANATVSKFAKASEEGTRAIMRAAPDATRIQVGKAKFNRDEIQEVNQRAKRVASTAEMVRESFRIYGTESRLGGATRYLLYRESDGTEFYVTVGHDDFSADDLKKLWRAAEERQAISLEVNLTINRGQVKAATISQVL